MLRHLLRLYRDDHAATAVEYAVLLALILVAVISAINAVGDSNTWPLGQRLQPDRKQPSAAPERSWCETKLGTCRGVFRRPAWCG